MLRRVSWMAAALCAGVCCGAVLFVGDKPGPTAVFAPKNQVLHEVQTSGKVVRLPAVLENASNRDLVIIGHETSCGCTGIEGADNKPLAGRTIIAGGKLACEIVVDLREKRGMQKFLVRLNVKSSRGMEQVSTEVQMPVAVVWQAIPHVLHLGSVEPGQQIGCAFDIVDAGQGVTVSECTIEGNDANDALALKLTPIEPSVIAIGNLDYTRRYRVSVSGIAKTRSGLHQYWIAITSSRDDVDPIRVPLVYSIGD